MSTLNRFCLIVATALALSLASVMPSVAQRREAEALHKQAMELYRAGKSADAIPLAERVLAIREKALGPDHPNVALSLNTLALLYRAQDRYANAEQLYVRSLAIYEKALGPAHPYIAASLQNLAALYDSLDRYADAEPLDKRSLAIYEKAFGAEHRDVAAALNSLAFHYYAQDRYADAEPLVRRTLEMRSAEKAIAFPVLFQSGQQNLISTADAFNYSFDTVQSVASSASAIAVSKLAAHFATGPDKELAY